MFTYNSLNGDVELLELNEEFNEQLVEDIHKKVIRGAHWFREAQLWIRITSAYNNPLNYGCVHSELSLIRQIENELAEFIGNKELIILGVGVGDTESSIVDIQLRRNNFSSIVGIDINTEFLNLFENSLKIRQCETPELKIEYQKIQGYFEDLSVSHPFIDDNQHIPTLICMLGSTIGNYNDTGEILELLQEISKKGDLILLGYQLSYNIDSIYLKYKNNAMFKDLIGNYLTLRERKRIRWCMNRNNSSIEAWLNDIQVFRSRKFEKNQLKEMTQQYKLNSVKEWVDRYNNICIHLFERI